MPQCDLYDIIYLFKEYVRINFDNDYIYWLKDYVYWTKLSQNYELKNYE